MCYIFFDLIILFIQFEIHCVSIELCKLCYLRTRSSADIYGEFIVSTGMLPIMRVGLSYLTMRNRVSVNSSLLVSML